MSAKASEIKQLEKIAYGEIEPFAQLFNDTSHLVYRFLIRMLGNKDEADYYLVMAYEQAWQLAGEYDPELPPMDWMLMLARGVVIVNKNDSEEQTDQPAELTTVATLDRQKAFIKAMEGLSLVSREVLGIVLLPGYTYHAIANIMTCSIDEVKELVNEAKAEVKERLKKFGISKHEVSKSNILRELIPLYINGALAGKHKKAFEKSLKSDSNLKQEYLEYYEIESYFDQLEGVSNQHLGQLFSKVKNNLDDMEMAEAAGSGAEVADRVKADFLHTLLSSSRIGWGLAILQFAILAVVLIFVVPQYSNSVQAEITSAKLLQQSKGKQLNIVFADDATHQQIRDLLLSVKAQMSAGPTDIGLYTVSVQGTTQRVNAILDKLRESDIVVLAVPAF